MIPVQLAAIDPRVRRLVAKQGRIWKEEFLPPLADHGVFVVSASELDENQRAAARATFRRDIFPALTRIALDPEHPFPHLKSGSLNVALALCRTRKTKRCRLPESLFAVVQVLSVLPL